MVFWVVQLGGVSSSVQYAVCSKWIDPNFRPLKGMRLVIKDNEMVMRAQFSRIKTGQQCDDSSRSNSQVGPVQGNMQSKGSSFREYLIHHATMGDFN
jgi:hypothetical protein